MNTNEVDTKKYPEIKVLGKNKIYGRMMLSNVGGVNSEMSAISLYFYNHIITDENISKTFKNISIVEMHHLDIFAELAKLLGENPRLWKRDFNRYTYWSPSYNKYPTKLKPLLENSLKGEEMAVKKYQNQAKIIKDPFIVEILNRIIYDELNHIEIFKSLLSRI